MSDPFNSKQTRAVLSRYSDETAKDIGYNNIMKILGMN
jgi:hypothetical protein